MATPPIAASTYSNSWLCSPAMTSKTRRASRSTSGPTPSPGSHAMRAFMYGNQIQIFNSFFTVGHFEEFDIPSFFLGYSLTREHLERRYVKFLEVADRKKRVEDLDLISLHECEHSVAAGVWIRPVTGAERLPA